MIGPAKTGSLASPNTSWLKPIAAALALAALCLAARIPWAGSVGFKADMGFFQNWASAAAQLRTSGEGIGNIYLRRRACNYPPLYLVVLSQLPAIDTWWHGEEGWEVPRVTERGRLAISPQFRTRNHLASLAPVLKLPAMVADLAITLLVLAWVWAHAGPQRAILASGLWALNPLSVYNSSYFGQVDAIHSLWMLGALLAAVDGRAVLAWGLVALALLTKLQAIVVVPVVALLTLRPLLEAAYSADHAALRRHLWTLGLAAAAALAIVWMVLAPYARAGTLSSVKRVYADSVSNGENARVTVAAYNLWWLTLDAPVKTAVIRSDKKQLLGGFTARHIGFALLGFLTAVACGAAYWGGGRCSAMLAAPIIALAFFLVSTQMKSRYGFASVALMLPLIACGFRYGAVVGLLSFTFLLNCARVLSLPAGFFGLTQLLNGTTKQAWTGHIIAAVNLGVLAYLFFELLRCARRERRQRRAQTAAAQCGA